MPSARPGRGTLELDSGVFIINESLNFQELRKRLNSGGGNWGRPHSLSPSPIGNFTADNGTPVGLFNATLGAR